MSDISIVIVSYNVRDILARCLDSLQNAAPGRAIEVIVVDNASNDGTGSMVREKYPAVRLLANDSNRGFAAASNQGIAASRGRSLLLLNPDTEILPGALAILDEFIANEPDVGIVGPLLRYPNGDIQSSRRRFPTPLTALIESTVVQRWFSRQSLLDRFYMADRSAEQVQDVDWLVGACLLVRRRVIDEIGGLDERFFMYSEEVDWCRRARAAGWRIVFVPTAEVVHHEGRSSEQNVVRRGQNFFESRCRYYEKHFGPDVGRALRLCLFVLTSFDLIEEGIKLSLGHRPALRRSRLAARAAVLRYQWSKLSGYARDRC